MNTGSFIACAACSAPNLGTRFCETCGSPAAAASQTFPSPTLAAPIVSQQSTTETEHLEVAVGSANDHPTWSGRTTGWEKADKVAHGAGKVLNGTAWVIVKGYAIFLIVVALIVLFATGGKLVLPGLLILAYGIYLLAPGSKFVVW